MIITKTGDRLSRSKATICVCVCVCAFMIGLRPHFKARNLDCQFGKGNIEITGLNTAMRLIAGTKFFIKLM